MTDAWAAPDAPADDAPALVVPVPSAATTTATHGTTAADQAPELPVPLRPMTTSDRIDGALRILKLAPGTVVALAACAVVPLQLIGLLALGRAGTEEGGADGFFETIIGRAGVRLFATDSGGEAAIAVLLLLLEAMAVSFVACGMGALVSGWYFGHRHTSTPDVLRLAARRVPALAAAWFVVHLIELAFSVVLVLPALIPMAWFALTAPIIGIEQVGPIQAMRRSFRLTKRAFFPVVGTCLLVAVLDFGLRFALSAVGGLYADFELPAAWAVTTATGIGARLVSVPFVAGVAVLLHLDLRVRLEGLDIQLAADEQFPRATT